MKKTTYQEFYCEKADNTVVIETTTTQFFKYKTIKGWYAEQPDSKLTKNCINELAYGVINPSGSVPKREICTWYCEKYDTTFIFTDVLQDDWLITGAVTGWYEGKPNQKYTEMYNYITQRRY